MKDVVSVLFAAVLLTSACDAQVISTPPPICFAFNDPALAGTLGTAYASYYGSFVVHFTSQSTSTIDRIDLWNGVNCIFGCLPQVIWFDVYQTSSLGVPPSGPILATYHGDLMDYSVDGWHALVPSGTPVALTSGGTYALRIRGYSTYGGGTTLMYLCDSIPHDPAGVVQLPYQFVGTAYCPWTAPPFPPTGTVGLMLRFRGASCGPGPAASVTSLGVSCGSPSSAPYQPLLWSYTPPVMGSPWTVNISGPVNETALLFWSGGVNPAGSPIVAGSPCLFYLDSQSVSALAQLGAEPLVTATLPPSGTGATGWTFTIPSNPLYAGLVVGIQVAIVGPSGTIPLGGGLFCQTTNALQLTLGY